MYIPQEDLGAVCDEVGDILSADMILSISYRPGRLFSTPNLNLVINSGEGRIMPFAICVLDVLMV